MAENVEWVHWCTEAPSLPVHVYTEQCSYCGMKRSVEWDVDANLPLYTRDYLKQSGYLRGIIVGYKIGDDTYSPEDVTIVRKEE